MVGLDGHGSTAGEAHTFNPIGIECALRQELCATGLVGFLFEHVDKKPPNNFTLGFGIAFTLQRVDEKVGGINVNKLDVVMLFEHVNNIIGLVHPHQSMIHQDTCQLVAYGFMQQKGRD